MQEWRNHTDIQQTVHVPRSEDGSSAKDRETKGMRKILRRVSSDAAGSILLFYPAEIRE